MPTPEPWIHCTAPESVFSVPPGPFQDARQALADACAGVIVARAVLDRMMRGDYAANRRERPESLADGLANLAARDYILAAHKRRAAQDALDAVEGRRLDRPAVPGLDRPPLFLAVSGWDCQPPEAAPPDSLFARDPQTRSAGR